MKKGSRNNLQCYLTDSSSKAEKCRISKIPPDLGTPLATAFCSQTPAAFTMKCEQKRGEVACGAGMLECHSSSQGGGKKHPRALTAQLCMSHQCPLRKAGTGDVLVQKTLYTKKAMSVGGGGSSRASGDISQRNERFSFKLPRRSELKRPRLAVQLPTKD